MKTATQVMMEEQNKRRWYPVVGVSAPLGDPLQCLLDGTFWKEAEELSRVNLDSKG